MQAHRPEIGLARHQQEKHQERRQRVDIIWNGLQEHPETVDVVLLRHGVADGGRPTGDWRDDADRSRGGIQQVRELRAGDVVAVGQRTHHGADGHAVE